MNKLEQGYQLFRTWLSEYGVLSEENWSLLSKEIQYEKAEKNCLLLQHGEIENRIRFLLSGFVKACYYSSESTFVYSFRNSRDICCSVSSFFRDTPSEFSLDTVIPSEYLFIDKTSLNGLLGQIEELDNMLLKITNKHLEEIYQELAAQRLGTAEDRLRLFAQKHPDAIKYAKNKDIASALDLTPQTMSKLRKKLTLESEK